MKPMPMMMAMFINASVKRICSILDSCLSTPEGTDQQLWDCRNGCNVNIVVVHIFSGFTWWCIEIHNMFAKVSTINKSQPLGKASCKQYYPAGGTLGTFLEEEGITKFLRSIPIPSRAMLCNHDVPRIIKFETLWDPTRILPWCLHFGTI